MVTRHALGLDDQVFEDLVQASTEMNFAGWVWRTVMQNEKRLTFACFEDALIDVSTVPGFELLGLVLREAGFHGEFGFRQVQRLLQFEWFGHRFERSDSPLFTCIDLPACRP